MKILLKCSLGSIGPRGELMGKDVRDKDTDYLIEVIDGVEIDGCRFNVETHGESREIRIITEGSDLSDHVTPNYPDKINVVKQIVHCSPEARTTSSVLNKFIRKTNKVLSREPVNKGKQRPPNILLIKSVEEIS